MQILTLALLILNYSVFAQSVDVNDVSTSNEESTTIEITKGKSNKKNEALWQVVDGTASIEGDPAAMEKEARESFKKACASWKKELREDNVSSGNKIIAMDCGRPECSGSAGKKICSSSASYKIKTKLD